MNNAAAEPRAAPGGWPTVRAFLPCLLQFRVRVALVFVFLGCAKLANIGVPLLLKTIVDALQEISAAGIGGAAPAAMVAVPLALLVAYGALRLSTTLFNEMRNAVFAKVSQLTTRQIALQVFRHLHDLSLDFHLSRQTGRLSRDIERGSRSISQLMQYAVFHIVPTVFEMAVICVILLLNYDPAFAMVTAATAACYFVFTYKVNTWRNQIRKTMNEEDSRAHSSAVDALINYETVKYFNNEEHETRRFDRLLQRWEKASVRSQTSLALLNIGQGLIIACGLTALMVMAARGVAGGEMSIGDFVLVNAFLIQLYIPLSFLGTIFREIQHALTDMENMLRLLHLPATVRDRADARPLKVSAGRIEFRDVSFHYRPERPVLQDLGFTVAGGSGIAVVGHSGSGKSTLVRLLYRFYDLNAGAILIDGQDTSRCTLQSLRAAMGIVPQDTVLFNDTIGYNIAYGSPQSGDDDIRAAAEAAHLHDFISALPQGYATEVGERGLKLSGGEKQRVAIARTLLKNPPILIFDEATSALDSLSEQKVQAAIRAVSAGRTTLSIAHRLSTVVDADLILVLQNGRIAQSGAHPQLLQQEGPYRQMWQAQQDNARRHQGEGEGEAAPAARPVLHSPQPFTATGGP
ncbi:MAG: ABC transporter ATP-binding protein/permease [Gammaproteobacteria bacterium]|nr:ABC transporter ATP-binding protein/permease [Gammaproteobacteria bacterium]